MGQKYSNVDLLYWVIKIVTKFRIDDKVIYRDFNSAQEWDYKHGEKKKKKKTNLSTKIDHR